MAKTFDETELMDRVDNDVGFLVETIEMLTADGPPLVEQVRAAVESGDAAAVARHAHALKGMVSNFCAPQAQACALALETMGKGGDLTSATQAMNALTEHFAALSNELDQFAKARQ